MLTAGIDIGSLAAKCVVMDNSHIVADAILPTGRGGEAVARKVLKTAAEAAGIDLTAIDHITATGYGRIGFSFQDKTVTEITCHGKGVHFLFPEARIVVDIGGQDSKVIRVDANGNIEDFVMNDKCAAGSGRFLEVMARALEVETADMGEMALLARQRCEISNTCTVFAESEVISLVSRGIPVNEILAGICNSIAERVFALARRKISGKTREGMVVMSGGVAKNKGVVRFLEEKFGHGIVLPPEPQLVGALGAAVIGQKQP